MRAFYESPQWRSFGLGHPGGEASTRRLLELSQLPKGSRVLDFGCGAGASVRLLEQLGYFAFGVDRGECWTGDFDAVLCECTLSLIEDKSARLSSFPDILLVSDVYDGEAPSFEGFELFCFEDRALDYKSFAAKWLWETGTKFPCSGSGYFLAVYRRYR